jgi:hypothetical protein
MLSMTALLGGCHCRSIRVEFETALAPSALSLRTCQCKFCRKHGARNASDPNGRLRIIVRETDGLPRYRFGLGVTDFLVCRTCGVYVVATMVSDLGIIGTINVNVLDNQESLPRTAEPMVYEGETVEDRTTRRVRAWTPVTVSGAI